MLRRSSRGAAVKQEEESSISSGCRAASTAPARVKREVRVKAEPASDSSSSPAAAASSAPRVKRQRIKKEEEVETEEEEEEEQKEHGGDAHSPSIKQEAVKEEDNRLGAADEEEEEEDDEEEGAGEEEEDVEAQAAALGLSVYEYNRQQNIRLKNQQLQMLNLQGMASDIGLKRTAAASRPAKRKKRTEPPREGVRRSLRSSVRDPNYVAPAPLYVPEMTAWAPRESRHQGPLTLQAALTDELEGDEVLQMESVLHTFKNSLLLTEGDTAEQLQQAVDRSYLQPNAIQLNNFQIFGEGVKIIKNRATVLQFHPTASLTSSSSLLATADKTGRVSLCTYSNTASQSDWHTTVNVAEYRPHIGSVVDLIWGTADRQSLYSASRDGSIRRLDVQTEQFEEYFAFDEEEGVEVCAMAMTTEQDTLYVGDTEGMMSVVDMRVHAASSSSAPPSYPQHRLSTHALSSLSVNPLNTHLLASASKDRLVRVWDVRHMKPNQPLQEWAHGYAIHSVRFSPEGKMLLSTSYDNTLKLFSCVNTSGGLLSPKLWSPPEVVKHNNHTGRWVTKFRGVFSPGEAAFAIGNMTRMIDVFNLQTAGGAATKGKKGRAAAQAAASSSSASASSSSSYSSSFSTAGPPAPAAPPASTLALYHAEIMTSIPAAVAWHPSQLQVAGCTGSGRLYVFGKK